MITKIAPVSTRIVTSYNKGTTVRVTVRDPSRKVNHLSKDIGDHRKLKQSLPGLSVPPE